MTVIFKLGGSLLNLVDLTSRIQAVTALRASQKCLIVSGGGPTADLVREWCCVHRLSDETAHWLAISSLDLNRQLLQNVLGWYSAGCRRDADSSWTKTSSPLMLRMTEFLQNEEATGSELIPHNWSVTSDSLAAWVTLRWPADELVLIKSVPVPRGLTALEASQQGLVDEFFPQIAGSINRILWCNLRSPNAAIDPWLAKSAET